MLTKPEVHKKGWGQELWLHNSDKYAFKILEFEKERQTSLHFHMLKTETWLVASGTFTATLLDPATAEREIYELTAGAVMQIKAGVPHRLRCIVPGRIFEASTQHFDFDSYRIEKGDSQK